MGFCPLDPPEPTLTNLLTGSGQQCVLTAHDLASILSLPTTSTNPIPPPSRRPWKLVASILDGYYSQSMAV